jgi:hypothetical protein
MRVLSFHWLVECCSYLPSSKPHISRKRSDCLRFRRSGCSPLVVNSAMTSAQKIEIVIMAVPPKRPHLRRRPTGAAQGSIAIFERQGPKVSLVRVAAIRRTGSMYEPAARAGFAESSMAELCEALNFSCRYHATPPACLGKTMFLFSACAAGMLLDSLGEKSLGAYRD